MLVFLLHFLPEDAEASGLVRTLHAAAPAGSYLALSHGTAEQLPAAVQREETQLAARTAHRLHLRSREQIAAFFAGWELVEPGLVYLPRWRPESVADLFFEQPERSSSYGGVARKP